MTRLRLFFFATDNNSLSLSFFQLFLFMQTLAGILWLKIYSNFLPQQAYTAMWIIYQLIFSARGMSGLSAALGCLLNSAFDECFFSACAKLPATAKKRPNRNASNNNWRCQFNDGDFRFSVTVSSHMSFFFLFSIFRFYLESGGTGTFATSTQLHNYTRNHQHPHGWH